MILGMACSRVEKAKLVPMLTGPEELFEELPQGVWLGWGYNKGCCSKKCIFFLGFGWVAKCISNWFLRHSNEATKDKGGKDVASYKI